MQRRNFLLGAISIATAAGGLRLVSPNEVVAAVRPRPFRFMNFTVLSSGATMKAWNDPVFKARLLRHPDTILQSFWGDKAKELKIVIHEDTETIRHFVLPDRGKLASETSPKELLNTLEYETAGDTSFRYFLPADVIADALTSSTYRRRLIRAPRKTLADAGYEPRCQSIIIHQNSQKTHHLTLPVNPIDNAQLASMEQHVDDYVVAVSGQCCASGTCENACTKCHETTDTGDGSQNIGKDPFVVTPNSSQVREGTEPSVRRLREYLEELSAPVDA